VARAASAIRANYLQGIFTQIAAETRRQPPPVVDLVPLASGDAGTGIFFFVFPLMMAGLITAIVLLQLPTWGVGRRVIVVAAIGAIGALAAYLTTVELHVLPGKPLLLAYAFLLTQVYGQLMVGAAPLLKQYFLPFSLMAALILSVPSSGGTVTPDLLPTLFHDLSYAFPLSQGVTVTRSVAYFHSSGMTQSTLVLGLWAVIAAPTVAIAWRRQSRAQPAGVQRTPGANGSAPDARRSSRALSATSRTHLQTAHRGGQQCLRQPQSSALATSAAPLPGAWCTPAKPSFWPRTTNLGPRSSRVSSARSRAPRPSKTRSRTPT
jgi:hypothetical protein